MVCLICQKAYFGASLKESETPEPSHPGTKGGSAQQPVALGCGHVFHKQCAEAWLETDALRRCPHCKAPQHGSLTVLFMDLDDEDYRASKRFPHGRSKGCLHDVWELSDLERNRALQAEASRDAMAANLSLIKSFFGALEADIRELESLAYCK